MRSPSPGAVVGRIFKAALAIIVPLAVMTPATARGESITGTVVITKRLSKRNVTASVSMYQRGQGVDLGTDQQVDPLVLERERVAIYIDGPVAASSGGASIKQINRRFYPDTLVVPVGTVVSFPNEDPIFHNLFSLSKVRSFDLGNYPKGDTRKLRFEKPGIIFINCHLHPNMAATVIVAPNRWCTSPDAAGNFELRDLPPGQYRVVAWHRAAGFFRKTIDLSPGKDATISFLIPFQEPGHGGHSPGM